MSDDARGNRYSRTTKARWSVFEPHGHDDEMRDDAADDAGDDSGNEASRDGREETGALDPLLVAVAGELRRPVTLDAALDERIMALVAAERRPRREVGDAAASRPGGDASPAAGETARRAWRWLRRPKLVRITPLGGLSAVAGLAALLLVAVRLGGVGGEAAAVSPSVATAAGPAATARASTTADSIQVVQFVLVAPGAQRVT
ncbi:MAG: hypothetical protein ACYC2G_16650, partial [Gemmatimonadaceae bacterium]